MLQTITPDLQQVLTAVRQADLFSSLCSISQPTGAFGASGAPVPPPSGYTPTPGLQNIPCMNAPISEARIQATEVRQLAEVLSLNIRHVLLDGYFPTIQTNDLASVDGVSYTIMGVESDSQKTMTRLHLRTATV